jgi:hypothetical protein
MKRYKPIFFESVVLDRVLDKNSINDSANLENLVWLDKNFPKMTWDQAVENCPSGYRLPTISELYTICREKQDWPEISFDESTYWSSSTAKSQEVAWVVNFQHDVFQQSNKTNLARVNYVKS